MKVGGEWDGWREGRRGGLGLEGGEREEKGWRGGGERKLEIFGEGGRGFWIKVVRGREVFIVKKPQF